MADKSTIARPYAKAAFEEARDRKRLGPWSEALRTAAAVVSDSGVEALLGNPRVTPEELAALVSDTAGPQLDEEGRELRAHARRQSPAVSAAGDRPPGSMSSRARPRVSST